MSCIDRIRRAFRKSTADRKATEESSACDDMETISILESRIDALEKGMVSLRTDLHKVKREQAAATVGTFDRLLKERAKFYTSAGYPRRQYVIGLGTGRSGTVSLATLLDAQRSADVTHELKPLLPWRFDRNRIDYRLWQLEHRASRVVGDVAYFYLPYVPYIAEQVPDCRFVCLRRNREAVVESMMKKTPRTNLWLDHDGSEWDVDPIWDPTMPSYQYIPKPDAIGMYWDDYNRRAQELEVALQGRFRIFDLETTLNSDAGISELLDHVGVDPNERVMITDVHENRGSRSD